MMTAADRLRQVAQLARSFVSEIELETVLAQVTAALRSLRPDAVCAIRLLDPDAGGYRLAETEGFPAAGRILVVPFGEGLTHVVAETRRPLLVENNQRDPRAIPRHWSAVPGLTTYYGVPIDAAGELLGVINMNFPPNTPPTEDEQASIEVLATQAAVAIRNARLFAERDERRRAAEALADVSRALAQSLDADVIAQRVADLVRHLLHASCSLLFRSRPDAEELVTVAVSGELAPDFGRGVVFPGGSGLAGVAVRTRQVVATPDFLADARVVLSPDLRRSLEPAADRAVLAAPLIVQDRVIGALSIRDQTGRVFRDGERALAQAFADQAALAFHNAQVLKESSARQAQLEALLEVTQELSAIQSVESLLGMIAETCGRLLDSESVGFRLLEGDELVVTGTWGDASTIMNTRRLKIGESLSGIVALTGEPLSVTDIANDPRVIPAHRETLRRAGYKRWLGMPVKIGGRLVGVLSIRTRRDQDFSEGDLAIAAAFASHAAISIENARLYEAITGTNARLQEQATALEAKNAELDSFAYSVSHDLKSPLVTIEGIAGILLEDYGSQLDERGARYLQRLQANAQQMERLIGDLLALSRIGREARSPEEVNLADLVNGLQAELAGLIQARGIKVSIREVVNLWGIRTQIEQVFSNLLSNAFKYAGETASPSVEIGAIDRGDLIECYVRDNGIGIDPAYHSKIFEIFQRLKDVEAEGTGVGLAIVKRIVETAGGRIRVESTRGQGAAFYFTWPKRGAKARAGG
jgi:signal transduction histidine kinase